MANETMQKAPRRYEKMRDSSVDWLGEVPNHWNKTKISNIFSVIGSGTTPQSSIGSYYDDGTIPWVQSGDINGNKLSRTSKCITEQALKSYPALRIYKAPYIAIAMYGASVANISKVLIDSCTNQACCVLASPKTGMSLDYMFYALVGAKEELLLFARGGTQPNISQEIIRHFILPIPPLAEQIQIACYLDIVCESIIKIIDEAKSSIAEYKALKSSIIYEAVTKGLDPHAEMKDSGVEWIGKIPKHWCDINPKALFSQRKEKARPEDKQLTSSQQYGILFQKDYMELTGSKVVVVEKDFNILKHVENGDFVISMRSFQGGLEYSTKSGCISSAYVMLIPNLKLVYPRYFRWLFKSYSYIQALQSTSDLIRDGQAMRYSNFSQVRLIQVPLCEQEAIANYLDKKCTKIDDLIAEKQRLIEDLEAYKKSIIYEVVTGKRKIC